MAAKPPTYLLPNIINTKHCHSERSEESQMFSRSVVFLYKNLLTVLMSNTFRYPSGYSFNLKHNNHLKIVNAIMK